MQCVDLPLRHTAALQVHTGLGTTSSGRRSAALWPPPCRWRAQEQNTYDKQTSTTSQKPNIGCMHMTKHLLWFRGFLTNCQPICRPERKRMEAIQNHMQWVNVIHENGWLRKAAVLTGLQTGCSWWPRHQTATWRVSFPPVYPVAQRQTDIYLLIIKNKKWIPVKEIRQKC